MATLTASADELLKTRTIPELRDLVFSLENDGNSKITELQVMVGSKYHDFIQSADAIAAMQQKSEFLESNLCRFLQLSQDVVTKTRDLLSRTVDNTAADSKLTAPLKPYKAVDSHDVWSFLEDCDIFSAAKIIAQSKILLDACNTPTPSSSGGGGEGGSRKAFPYRFGRFLCPISIQEAASRCNSGLMSGSPQLLAGCSSAVFLSQTVLDDARLFLLEGSCSSEEKARTLASVGLISPEIGGCMHRGALLLMYLQGADVLLESAIEGLGERERERIAEHHTGSSRPAVAKRSQSHNSAVMGEKLVQAVQTLQQAILDVHLLFFKPASVPSTGTAAVGASASVTVPGLVILKQLEFISDVDRALSPLLNSPPAAFVGGASAGASKHFGFDRNAFLADERASSSHLDIRKVFDQWIERAVQRVGERARAALEAMESATEVARLQQRVWLCCTTVTTGIVSGPASTPSTLPEKAAQADWEEACVELLAVKRRRTTKNETNTAAAAASLLWSRVFRLPFMLQVERLLRESCMGVLRGAKGLLLQALAQEGVAIDPVTLTASLTVASAARGPTPSSSSGGGSGSGSGTGYVYSTLCTPSPRIFRKAEAVRCLLQEELNDLLRDIIVPVQEGDPESSTGLSRALFIQCSQLAGQLAIMLRCLCASLTSAIDANSKATLATAGKALNKVGAGGASVDPNAPYLSGLLLVGRLSWLLKIRGRFLEEALSSTPLSPAAPTPDSVTVSHDLVSEDQMRSAFEIADTNGDGVLTYHEAVEAVNALAVNDADSYATSSGSNGNSSGIVPGSNIPFLSPRLSPSLNFNEFALLCAHLMSASACSPVERLKSCFDETLSLAHSQWAKRAVAVYTASFSSGLTGELGGVDADTDTHSGPTSTSPQSQTKLASFKSTWKQVWVELDAADSSESSREQVALPTYVCASLANFLFSLSHCAACSLLSVDTVQQLPSADLFAPLAPLPSNDEEEKKVPVSRMAHFASSQLYEVAISTVADTYSALLDKAASTACLSDEDVALQVVFDLMACVALEARCGLEGSRSLSRCLSGWRARLDPINAEILTPMLTAASEQFSQKTHLLLPGLQRHRDGAAPVPVAAASSSQAAMNSNASAISGLFPLSASSRFSLLPLPMSTHFQGSSWIDRDRERDRERDRDRGGVTEKAPEESPYTSKSLLSGLSLSQQQHHAEQLGKSLISTWGTFLGSNTAEKKTRKLHE